MATAKKTELVEIKPVNIQRVRVRIVGDSPLITHKWSEKAKKEIRDKELGLLPKGKARPIRKPVEEAVESLYWVKGKPSQEAVDEKGMQFISMYGCQMEQTDVSDLFGKGYVLGFPAVAFKMAALSAAYRKGWTENMVGVKGEFHIEAYDEDKEIEQTLLDMRYIRVKGDVKPVFREDNVKVGMGSADLRYRAQVNNWYADIVIAYDANGKYTLNHILNFLNAGGFSCGVGEWRTEKNGDWGCFHVEIPRE